MSEPKGNEPAFPISTSVVERFRPESGIADKHYPGQTCNGLSKREYFAAMPLTETELSMLKAAYDSQTQEKSYTLQSLRFFHADRMIAESEKV